MNSIKYRKGYKYQLTETYTTKTRLRPAEDIQMAYVTLLRDGTLTVYAGYAWNGPSGPTWDTLNSLRGSLEHDVKYQLIRLGLLLPTDKGISDSELLEVLLEDGMHKWRAGCWCWGVIRFGRKSTLPSAEPMVLSAP